MLEGEYLELVNDLKKKFDEKEREVDKIKEECAELKKVFISAYGFIRVMDIMADNSEIDFEIKGMISIIRSFLSEMFDTFFRS